MSLAHHHSFLLVTTEKAHMDHVYFTFSALMLFSTQLFSTRLLDKAKIVRKKTT